ncbi:hypothetical protein ACU5DF_23385 [Aliivibrio wodanis]|uniref:hypothetical protein n=1 Tax=Aliivibrio wodanis TaxID=80852 RepID=UPI00406D00C7
MKILFFTLLLFTKAAVAEISSERWNVFNSQLGVVASLDGQGHVATFSSGVIQFSISSGACSERDENLEFDVAVDSTLIKMVQYCNSGMTFIRPLTIVGFSVVIGTFKTLKEVKVFNSTFTTNGFNSMYELINNTKPSI